MGCSRTRLYLILGLLMIAVAITSVESSSDEQKIYNYLFVTNSYNKNLRPVENSSRTVDVDLEFDLLTIKAVDEVNQVMSFVGFIVSKWEDDHLKWNASDFGGRDKLVVPASTVWLPDFAVVNSADAFYNSDFTSEFRVLLTSDGKVTWDFGGTFSVNCELDLTFYPFDMQVCYMGLENWMYDKAEVSLKNASSHVLQDKYTPNGMWNVITTKTYYKDVYFSSFPGVAFPLVKFEMFLERRPGYYMVNIIGPGILLILLALFGCCLPADSGEKVGLGITIILSFSVYQLIIADSTPKTSIYTPLITMWMFLLMITSTADTLVAILVLYQNHHRPTTPPRWLSTFYFRFLARVLCMKSIIPEETDPNEVVQMRDGKSSVEVEDMDRASKEKKRILADYENAGLVKGVEEVNVHLRVIAGNISDQNVSDALVDQWKAMGMITDRLCLIISSVVVLIATVVCFTMKDNFGNLLVRAGH